MHEKRIIFNDEARKKMFEGVEILYNAVSSTLGPKGRTALIDKVDNVHVTKDGVSVAESIKLEDPYQNVGVKLVKEAASISGKLAGDGTTSTIVIAYNLILNGLQRLESGDNPADIIREIEAAKNVYIKAIKELAVEVPEDSEKLKQIATISSNNDEELGELVSNAVMRAGKDGVVLVEENQGYSSSIECVEGLRFDQGYASSMFINEPQTGKTVYNDCYVLFADMVLDKPKDLVPIMQQTNAMGEGKKPLVIIAKDFKPEVLSFLVLNAVRDVQVVAVKAPGYASTRRNFMEDMSIFTKACRPVSENTPQRLENLNLSQLGVCDKIVITSDSTTIIGGKGNKNAIEERLILLKTQLKQTELSSEMFDKEKLRQRISRLSGKVSIVYVGGTSEVEVTERRDRVDDAVAATMAAMEEGIVPGGGFALCSIPVDGEWRQAFCSTYKKILENAGLLEESVKEIDKKIIESNFTVGYNSLTDEFGDMIEMGIIDPAKVVRMSVEHAVSVAKTYLTCNTVICEASDF